MTTDIDTVTADTTLSDLATRMLEERQTTYLVTDGNGGVAGIVSVDDFKRSRGQVTIVREVMDTDIPRIAADTPLFDVFALMNRDRVDAAIVEEAGEIQRVITTTEVAMTLQIRREAGAIISPRTAM